MFYVYILWSEKAGKFYIGHTANLTKRIKRHNAGWEKSTKPYVPWRLAFEIRLESKSEAVILERKLKNLSQERLQRFINKTKTGLSRATDNPDF